MKHGLKVIKATTAHTHMHEQKISREISQRQYSTLTHGDTIDETLKYMGK